MTIKQLAVKLCKKEGKKKQVNVAQMHEVLGIVSDILHHEWENSVRLSVLSVLLNNGAKRAKKKDKKVSRTVK